MIRFRGYSFWYPGMASPTLEAVDVTVAEGDFALAIGLTGSGKSTLLRAVNGLVPHFTGGHVEGSVVVQGLDPRDRSPREFAGTVGVVGQDPLAGFVTDTVEEELAYGMEQLAVAPQAMRRRVEEILDLMGIARLRRRTLRTLSGGEQQRVALGAVLTSNPRVLVLDEPTSALDPAAAEDALAAVLRLVHDLGVTVLAAEHRLERVVEYTDQVLVVDDHRCRAGRPAEMLADAPLAPPVVELGRLFGWDPLALSVRDARRLATPVQERLAGIKVPARTPALGDVADGLDARSVVVRYGDVVAVRGADLQVAPGEVVALMGRNGSGKSSLLWAIQGSGRRSGGMVRIAGRDSGQLSRNEAAALVALVPQQAADLLYHDSIRSECAAADQAAFADPGTARRIFDELCGGSAISEATHPRDLSDGQRLSLALAVQLSARPRVVLLDEPTRGLDYRAKARLKEILARLAAAGKAVVVATHDVEFVAQSAQRVVVLAEGEVVTSAPTSEALAASPVFAPQVAKVLAPLGFLTTAEVSAALATAPRRPALPGGGVRVVWGGAENVARWLDG
ncbi:MAG: energy-coupling factor transport system ATP-binding protein [Nocardioidaceae bacterium]|nr:energy-coupling factor transport system ATP-binding protein [Nocardioidaceae bacterium]